MSSNLRIVERWLPAEEIETVEGRLASMIAEIPIVSDVLIDKAEKSGSIERLSGHDGIDSGEQLLLGILIDENHGKVLVTGDKRCVATFAKEFPQDCNAAQSSLISFEKCLCEIEKKYGFDLIREKAHANRNCDGSLRLAFGEKPNADQFRAALLSFDPLSTGQADSLAE